MLAEARAFNLQLEQVLATMPKVHELPPEVTRRVRRDRHGISPRVFSAANLVFGAYSG